MNLSPSQWKFIRSCQQNSDRKFKKVNLTHRDKYQSFLKKHCCEELYAFQVLILKILNKQIIFLIHVTHLFLQALGIVIYPSHKNWTKEHPLKSLFLLLSFIYSLLTFNWTSFIGWILLNKFYQKYCFFFHNTDTPVRRWKLPSSLW